MGNKEKILYILTDRKIKPSKFMDIYRQNNGDINKTIKHFLGYENLKLNLEAGERDNNDPETDMHERDKYGYLKVIDYMLKNKVELLCIGDRGYPDILKQIYSPPPLLFFKGNKIKEMEFGIAIVGSRKCTAYGREAAGYISRNLSEIGITVVSGLALGIDSYAHKAALEGKGGTIGILGCGIDIVYPPENKFLYEEITINGSIATEYFPATPPFKSNFPVRNRIISGLCRGVIVIEAGEKSGAVITCEMALKQNREVFAVPGNIFSPASKGCHKLIKNGAKLVERIDDILEEFSQVCQENLKLRSDYDIADHMKTQSRQDIGILGNEARIYEFIGFRAKSVEEIVRYSKMEVGEVLGILVSLEIKQLIREDSFNKYSRLF
ncbi:MAG: DNA-processing protein DprA [Actinomycetota bacterium]|nr:DNA-processing protein DprA [Actinomycetota bacterium]